jgi:hypothetical protein
MAAECLVSVLAVAVVKIVVKLAAVGMIQS